MWMEACDLSEEMFESIRKKVIKHGGYITMIKNSDYLPYVEDVLLLIEIASIYLNILKKALTPKEYLIQEKCIQEYKWKLIFQRNN